MRLGRTGCLDEVTDQFDALLTLLDGHIRRLRKHSAQLLKGLDQPRGASSVEVDMRGRVSSILNRTNGAVKGDVAARGGPSLLLEIFDEEPDLI